MKILLLGSGGREHAFAWKIKQSNLCSDLYVAPGNAGTQQFGENIPIAVSDFNAIKNICLEKNIDMVIVGPEDPLVAGIYDFFADDEKLHNITVIGPSKKAAQLEGSKAFSKQFMARHNIPTAGYKEFTIQNYKEGLAYVAQHSLPVVLKADGLAAGKGVVICNTNEEAEQVFTSMLQHHQFGDAGKKVVVEEFLKGIEISVFVITDGKDYKIIGHAKDYKRVGEGDTGPNTGGMGCVSPVPFADENFMHKVVDSIIKPTINGIQAEQLDYRGFVFFGLINVDGNPYIIEYNCRMGDPEAEVILPRLKNDIVALCNSLYNGTLGKQVIETDNRSCATVVAVSEGYPGDYTKGLIIDGLTAYGSANDTIIFHSGTKQENGNIITNGGRVLAITAYGKDIKTAAEHSMKTLSQIKFKGMYYRRDIGYEFQ